VHALSLPTWWIHISSLLEWVLAMGLVVRHGRLRGEPAWCWLALAMTPALVSALCACTWHVFDNASTLKWLVTMQAATTLLGNSTLALAAWWLWKCSPSRSSSL